MEDEKHVGKVDTLSETEAETPDNTLVNVKVSSSHLLSGGHLSWPLFFVASKRRCSRVSWPARCPTFCQVSQSSKLVACPPKSCLTPGPSPRPVFISVSQLFSQVWCFSAFCPVLWPRHHLLCRQLSRLPSLLECQPPCRPLPRPTYRPVCNKVSGPYRLIMC